MYRNPNPGNNLHPPAAGFWRHSGLDENGRPADTRTPQQKQVMVALLRALKADYPQARICGHRDLSPDRNGNGTIDRWERTKECPCFDALHEYEEL